MRKILLIDGPHKGEVKEVNPSSLIVVMQDINASVFDYEVEQTIYHVHRFGLFQRIYWVGSIMSDPRSEEYFNRVGRELLLSPAALEVETEDTR